VIRRAVLIAALCIPAAARAQPDGRHLVAADAAVAVRADPAELEQVAALARGLGGDVGMAANLLSLGAATALGFDPLAAAGWRAIGVDPAHPVFLQVSASGADRPRHARLVARAADPARFDAWAAGLPVLDRRWVAARGGDPGALLGLSGAEAREAGRALRDRGVIAAGAVPALGALLVLRRDGDHAVIDAIAIPPQGWSRRGEQVLALLAGPAPRASIAARRSAGAALLSRPGVTIWTRPGGAVEALAPRTLRDGSCAALHDAARRAALVDAALSLQVRARRLSLEVAWGVAAGAPLGEAFPRADDGLVGPPRPGGAIAAGSLLLAGTGRLRALPRGALVRAGWVPFWRRVRACGEGARLDAQLFLWPELAAQWLHEVAELAPGAAALVGGVRNVAVAATRVSARDRRDWRALAEVSLEPAARPAAQRILEAVFGERRTERRPRPHQAWGGGVLRPYALSAGRALRVIGVGFGPDSVTWRLRRAGPGRRRAPRELLRLRGDAGAILRQIADDLPPRAAIVGRAAARRVGSVSGSLTAGPDAIRLTTQLRLE